MKISNSKKQLAKIIHENGGWRDGYDFASQDGDDYAVWFYDSRPVPGSGRWWKACGRAHRGIEGVGKLPNWHQTILSRDEYFHQYPVAETAPEPVSDAKPTIEQLAADYRNAKNYADRKQQEVDAAKADAEAKLAELVAAGKALGLVLSVVAPESELVITDWRYLRVGDRIWVGDSGYDNNCPAGEYDIADRDHGDDGQPVGVMWSGRAHWPQIHERGWRFIRRP